MDEKPVKDLDKFELLKLQSSEGLRVFVNYFQGRKMNFQLKFMMTMTVLYVIKIKSIQIFQIIKMT